MSPVVARFIRRLAQQFGGNYRAMKRAHVRATRSQKINFRKAAKAVAGLRVSPRAEVVDGA